MAYFGRPGPRTSTGGKRGVFPVRGLPRLDPFDPINAGLIGYWPLDGETIAGVRAADASGKGNSGTLNSGPTLVRGPVGQALAFNANSWVDTGLRPVNVFGITNGYAVSLWTRITNVTVAAFISDDSAADVSGMEMFLNSAWFARMRIGGVDKDVTGGTPLAGVDYSVTFTYDGAGVSLYVNDALIGTTAATGNVNNSTSTMQFGRRADNVGGVGNFNFDGSVSRVRLYNRPLSRGEVSRLYSDRSGTLGLITPAARVGYTASASASGAGASAGTSTAPGVSAAQANSVGASAGTSTALGAGASQVNAVGASAGTSMAPGVSTATGSGVGAAAGTSTAPGVSAATAASVGASAGTSTVPGVSAATAASVGSAAGTSTAPGIAVAPGTAAGQAAGTSTALGVSAATVASVGSATGTSTALGVGASPGAGAGAGASTGTSTALGVSAATARSVGASAGTSVASGVGVAAARSAGAAAGTSSTPGVGAATARSAGIAGGTSTALGVSAVQARSVGVAAGAGTAPGVGIGTAPGAGAGTAAGTSTALGYGFYTIAGHILTSTFRVPATRNALRAPAVRDTFTVRRDRHTP